MVEREQGEYPQIDRFPIPHIIEHDGRNHVSITNVSLDGELREFIILRNDRWNLNVDEDRRSAAEALARLKVHLGVNAALGPQVHRFDEVEQADEINASFPRPDEWEYFDSALYIEKSQWHLVSPYVLGEIPRASELRRNKPKQFEEAYQKALAVLPDKVEF